MQGHKSIEKIHRESERQARQEKARQLFTESVGRLERTLRDVKEHKARFGENSDPAEIDQAIRQVIQLQSVIDPLLDANKHLREAPQE